MRCIDADLINRDTFSDCENATECVYAIGNILTADVQPVVHGEWDNIYYDDKENSCMCSICRSTFIFEVNEDLFNYCPDCGAKMDGGNDEPTT